MREIARNALKGYTYQNYIFMCTNEYYTYGLSDEVEMVHLITFCVKNLK